MLSRRQVLHGGLGAVAASLLPHRRRFAGAFPPTPNLQDPGAEYFPPGSPFFRVTTPGPLRIVDGMPVADGFTGDPFPEPHLRFPTASSWFRERIPPTPTETVPLVVVGGGISGLATAYLLREHDPVVFDLNLTFGGSARGESWADMTYSLGGAYVITPDPGSTLEALYQELDLHTMYRLDAGQLELELGGRVVRDRFWSGEMTPDDARAFARYAEVVTFMAEESYPCIPVDPGPGGDWIRALDAHTFKNDIETRMGMPAPPPLAAAVQAYCYSSFGAGWEEISAASGWNFLAAEEYGRWVFPGGNARMAYQFWRALAARETAHHRGLRPGSLVVDVRMHPKGAQVTWVDSSDRLHSMLAKRVVMACPKNVCRRMLWNLESLDPGKFEAMHHVHHSGYVVANVLLRAPVERDFYDIFLLRDGDFPTSAAEAEANSRAIDLLNGAFARGPEPGSRSVLTLYWPLPWSFGQHTLLQGETTWTSYATRLVPQVREMLALLEVPEDAVDHVRMTMFGHAMPVADAGFIAGGFAEAVRRPLEDRVYFVQQDNWALPAVENCLLDAMEFAPEIEAGL